MRQESHAPAGSVRDPARRAVKINMGYAKIHGEILHSTVWVGQPGSVRLTWLTMLILADEDGYVGASVPGLASTAGCSISECEAALALFKAPDPHSRTKDYEGRRIVDADGGWIVLNHWKYRDYRTKKQVQAARRQAAFKERQRDRIENGPPRVSRVRSARPALPASAVTEVTPAHVYCLDPLAGPDQDDPHPDPLAAKDPTGSARVTMVTKAPPWWRGPKARHRAIASDADEQAAQFRLVHFRAFPGTEDGVDDRFELFLRQRREPAPTVTETRTKRRTVPGAPRWVYVEHATFARKHALVVVAEAARFADEYQFGDVEGMAPADLFRPFMEHLERAAGVTRRTVNE